MIISQKQLTAAKKKMQMLEESLTLPKKKNVPNELHSATKGQIEELISEIKSEVSDMNKHKGTTFDSFLKEEGLLEETEAVAIKHVIAYALEKKMKKAHLTKTAMAEQMGTSRSALDRLLDPIIRLSHSAH